MVHKPFESMNGKVHTTTKSLSEKPRKLSNSDRNLCWKCLAILNEDYPKDLGIIEEDECTRWDRLRYCVRILKTKDSVQTTAAAGCPLCRHFLHMLSPAARTALREIMKAAENDPSESDIEYEYLVRQKRGKWPLIALHVYSTKFLRKDEWSEGLRCSASLVRTEEISAFAERGAVAGDTQSQLTWSHAANWIDQCNKRHKLCTTTDEGLPTRIIDIGSGELATPKLVVVTDETARLPYATLSHCWGSYMPLRLLSSNLSLLEKEIPISQLSKTFQDALVVTRRLGLRYLWIDSLCIIQDSTSDWEKQSAVMSQIYSNSYCNIAADHAVDGRQGCFAEREPDLVRPFVVSLDWGFYPELYYVIQSEYWNNNVLKTPLLSRAWVRQERLLSPRNLHFGATQVHWECRENLANESFPCGIPSEIEDSNLKTLEPAITGARLRVVSACNPDANLDVFTLWNKIVETYSSGKLTYKSDRLVALSGVAARLYQYTNCEYLAGLWMKHLAYQLVWYLNDAQPLVDAGSREVYTAPSWSWASIPEHVKATTRIEYADDRQVMLEVLQAKTELVHQDSPFGQVKSGFLRLRCKLAKISVQTAEPSSVGEEQAADLLIEGTRHGTVNLDCPSQGKGRIVHRTFYYLPVLCLTDRKGGVIRNRPLEHTEVEGLVLQPVAEKTNTFVRVGSFHLWKGEFFRLACQRHSRRFNANDSQSDGWGADWEITII